MTQAQAKYQKHILVCVNERPADNPRGDCARCGGMEIRLKFANLIQEHGLKGKVRASKTYCLDACELGPVVAIYPDDIWYCGISIEDVPRIFETSVLKDEVLEDLVATEATWAKLKALRAAEIKPKQTEK